MKSEILSVLVGSLIFFQGCTHTMKMSGVGSPEQDVGYQETITSLKKHFVSLAPLREYDRTGPRTSFILFVQNGGDSPIEISCDVVAATFEGKNHTSDLRNIDILSFDDLMKDSMIEQYHQARGNYWSSGAMPEYYHYLYASPEPYINERKGQMLISDLSYISCSSDVATCESQYQVLSEQYDNTSDFLSSIRDNYGKASETQRLIADLALKPRVLMPGEGGGGLVVCSTRSLGARVEGDFHFVVSVDGELHEFTFNRSLADGRQDRYE